MNRMAGVIVELVIRNKKGKGGGEIVPKKEFKKPAPSVEGSAGIYAGPTGIYKSLGMQPHNEHILDGQKPRPKVVSCPGVPEEACKGFRLVQKVERDAPYKKAD